MPRDDFALLLDNLHAGLTPTLVTVGLQWDFRDKDGPLAFDAPDGSETLWRNTKEENQRVGIKFVEFHYRLIGEDDFGDVFGEDAKPSTVKASIDAASAAIVAKLDGWEKAFVKSVTAIGVAIAIAAVIFGFLHR
jgi:hypothetical protein